MKKYLLSLFAIVIAIGLSALTTARENGTWVFYQLCEGEYFLNPGDAYGCAKSSCNPCTITYNENPGVIYFIIEERPEGGTDSPLNKLYNR